MQMHEKPPTSETQEAPIGLEQTVWWGHLEIPEGQQATWHAGALEAWIQHLPHEWRIAHRLDESTLEQPAYLSPTRRNEILPSDVEMRRYCFSHMGNAVRLVPCLPDRPVVTRPDKPLYVYPGEQATLYLSFPLWVRVEVGEPARSLAEIPSFRLSDTWFGPNTREGELCYASRTFGRLHLHDLPRRAHRIITAVIIRNHASDSLYVERINVNLPMLSIYRDRHEMLWTNAVVLERQEGQGLATLSVERRPPPEVEAPTFIGGPRQTDQRSRLVRAFSSFLG